MHPIPTNPATTTTTARQPIGQQMRIAREWAIHDARSTFHRDRRHAAIIAAVLDISTETRTEVSPLVALKVVRHIGDYNALEAPLFARLLRDIDRIMGRKHYPPAFDGMDNPNDGDYAYRLAIGNEGSLVLYVSLWPTVKWQFNQATGRSECLPNPIPADTVAALARAAERAQADEYWQLEHDPATYRIWWD